MELDKFTKEAIVNGQEIRLTAKEFAILELLMSYPGRVYSADEIYEAVWNEDAYFKYIAPPSSSEMSLINLVFLIVILGLSVLFESK